jgi:branched-chain amino acid transport system permease protein
MFLIAIGAVVAAVLWWFLERTRLGAMVRAGVDDEETTRAIGINVSALFMAVYGTGAALAALGGVLGGALVGVYPGADFEVLLLGFVVVIVGGLGSLRGALLGALFVGLVDNFGKAYFPELAPFSMFLPMVLVLTLRPNGLFGRP